jgi:hypothetical protein
MPIGRRARFGGRGRERAWWLLAAAVLFAVLWAVRCWGGRFGLGQPWLGLRRGSVGNAGVAGPVQAGPVHHDAATTPDGPAVFTLRVKPG